MSFQDSCCSPIRMMNADYDTLDDDGDEMKGGIELGELLDIEFDFDDLIETVESTTINEAQPEFAAIMDDTHVGSKYTLEGGVNKVKWCTSIF